MSAQKGKDKEFSIPLTFFSVILIIVGFFLFFFNRFDELLYSPLIDAEKWCEVHPCIDIRILSFEFTLSTPTSSIFVFALGIITVSIGIYFLKKPKDQESLTLWGISLIFWGLGALFAGISYQAFGYQLKCAGRSNCLWTTWFEIVYLMLTIASVNLMVFAQLQSAKNDTLQTAMKVYAYFTFLSYVIIILIGSLVPIRFLISFELLVLFILPTFLLFFIYNLIQYNKTKKKLPLKLVGVWVILGIIILVYFIYLLLGITEQLWQSGIWLSSNDILHIGLILWMVYIGLSLPKYI